MGGVRLPVSLPGFVSPPSFVPHRLSTAFVWLPRYRAHGPLSNSGRLRGTRVGSQQRCRPRVTMETEANGRSSLLAGAEPIAREGGVGRGGS